MAESGARQGFGLDDTLGLAGFPSGEAYKVGRRTPYFRLHRAFVRETLNFSPAATSSTAGPNQFETPVAADRLVVTVGKFSVADVFDVNRYAHDPRGDFLNWSIIDAGSFDYAADAWGYTIGLALEWYTDRWTWRAGFFDLSDVPNSPRLEPGAHEYQLDGELEHRHDFNGHPGKVLLTVFESHARMARLADAVAVAEVEGAPVEPAPLRRWRKRDGISFNFEQELTSAAGVFARAGSAGGNVETYEFTDIDRSISVGASLRGSPWHRSDDTLALALAQNDISAARRRYLAAGGLGILIGDGRLPRPGPEQIVETYYQLTPCSGLQFTLDHQWIAHPAYNRDRGPVSVLALRAHLQF